MPNVERSGTPKLTLRTRFSVAASSGVRNSSPSVKRRAGNLRELLLAVFHLRAHDLLRAVDGHLHRPRRAARRRPGGRGPPNSEVEPFTTCWFSSRFSVSSSGTMSSSRAHLHGGRLHGLGPRHQVEAHLGDHAHVALPEQAIDPGTVAPLVVLPGLRIRQRAHAGAHDFAIGQHHFHAAMRAEVIAEGMRPSSRRRHRAHCRSRCPSPDPVDRSTHRASAFVMCSYRSK